MDHGRSWHDGARVLLAVLVTAAAAPACAVTAAFGAPGPAADGIVLTATGEILYDSNQLRTTSAALLNGGHRDDFRYSPSAGATYSHGTGRLSLMADALVGHDFFQYNSYLDRNRFTGGGVLTYRTGSSCQAAINGNYSSRQGGLRGDTLDETDPGTPDDVGKVIDNVQEATAYGATASCGTPSGRLSFQTNYAHSSLHNASIRRQFGNSDSDTYSGSVGIGILRPGQLALNGSYSTIAYPDRLVGGGGIVPSQLVNTGIHTYRIGLSVTRPIGTRLSGTFGASYLRAEPTGGQAPYSSPAYNVGVTYTASPRLGFGLIGSRDILASSTAGALFRVVDQVAFSGHYLFGRAITFDANLGLIQNDYKESFAIAGEPARHNELTKTAGISVTYAPRRLYDVVLGVSQTMRSSDPNAFNYNSTKVSLVLAVHL